MTVTVKLTPQLEAQLRLQASRSGRTASDVIRAALQSYLASAEAQPCSPYELGEDLFGQHGGAPTLAADRKRERAAIWDAKHSRRP